MSTVAIVTDSTADLPVGMARDADISIVPLWVTFGDTTFRDGVDLSVDDFWARLLDPASPMPKTAAPSPGAFIEAFEARFAGGAGAIVCPVIGSRLSATFQAARLAAETLPGREIHVVDTGTTSMGTGIAALLAASFVASGLTATEVAARVTDRLRDIDLYVAVDTLEYLRKNGRLSPARAAIGTVLSVKPIITVRDGEVVLAETPRTRGKARDRVIELVTATPIERLAIMHTPTSGPDEVAAFRERLVAAIPGGIAPDAVTTALIGPSTGPHLGPNLMGAVFLRRSGADRSGASHRGVAVAPSRR